MVGAALVVVIATPIAPPRQARADDVTVPIALQIDLLGRVASYERNFASRPGSAAVVLVVTRRGNAESARAAGQIEAALRRASTMGGRPVQAIAHPFTSAASLRAAVDGSAAAIVYLTPGLGGDIAGIAQALDGAAVLSVSAVANDADHGIVLGFELVEARPKLVVNLRHARRQSVEFSSRFLRLARVIQ
jgi:hypothetical protein